MKKSIKQIKKLESYIIENTKAVKGGTDIIVIRTPRYRGDRG